MRIPILTYDSMRIHGNEYATNDLRALASDLRQVTAAGFKVVPLARVIDAWLANRGADLDGKLIALSSDHGADFNYRDLPHPTAGAQRSVLNILRDFAAQNPRKQEELNVTSFVIVSPEARAVLDATCMVGKGWWTDSWWMEAIRSGLIHIASQSWDLNHETLPPSLLRSERAATFRNLYSRQSADHR